MQTLAHDVLPMCLGNPQSFLDSEHFYLSAITATFTSFNASAIFGHLFLPLKQKCDTLLLHYGVWGGKAHRVVEGRNVMFLQNLLHKATALHCFIMV